MTPEIRDVAIGVPALTLVLDAVLNSFELLLMTSDLLFPILSVASSSIVGEVGFISQGVMTKALLFVATLYILRLVSQFWGRVTDNETA